MATRFQTYETSYGFCTIDTNSEEPPEEYISGPYDVNMSEAELIQDGAGIVIVDGEAIVEVD